MESPQLFAKLPQSDSEISHNSDSATNGSSSNEANGNEFKKKMHEKVLYIYISYLHCATYSGQRVIFSTNRRMVRPHSSAVTQHSVPESSHNSQSTSDDSNSNNIDGEPAFFFHLINWEVHNVPHMLALTQMNFVSASVRNPYPM